MELQVLRFNLYGEAGTDMLSCQVAHVERDSKQFVTVYGTERNGSQFYFILDQELIDTISQV